MKMRRNVVRRCEVQALEGRRLLSVSMSQSGSTLSIVGDDAVQNLRIADSWTAGVRETRVYLDSNGDGLINTRKELRGRLFTNVSTFDIRLGGGGDTLEFLLPDGYDGANKSISINTGRGADHILFSNVIGNPIRNSSVSLDIRTNGGNDTIDLSLAELTHSTLTANLNPGAGNDTLNLNAGGRVANSSVTLDADLGDGNDRATQRIDWDNFDLLGATSAWRANIAGGAGDDVLDLLGDLGNSSARVQGIFSVDLLGQGGNDRFSVNPDQFILENGGSFRVGVNGGAGTNSATITNSSQATLETQNVS